MTGAIVLAIWLNRHGAARETMIIFFVTIGATILSILLFRVLNIQGKERR
jgi:hypothetical protein